MQAEVSKIAESCEEACQASSKVMPLKQIRNINGQRCDMRKVWYPSLYHVDVLLGSLEAEKGAMRLQIIEHLCRKDDKFMQIQHVEQMQV